MKKKASSQEADVNWMAFIFDELDCLYLPQNCWAVIYKLLQNGQKFQAVFIPSNYTTRVDY